MSYLLHFVVGILFILICKWQYKVFFNLAQSSVHLLDAYLMKGEDDDKLPIIEKRTGGLLKSLLLVIGILVLAFALSFGLLWLADTFLEWTSIADLSSTWGILALSAGATLPFFIPNKSKSAYSPLAQLLHHLALDNYNLGYRLFKRESKKFGIETKDEFVIITGLARAGTTSMLNTLIELGPFASLNYGNMPFLMSPNTWGKFYKPKSEATQERSHGDGIKIALDSNEALEEYFFKAITNDSFIGKEFLQKHSISHEGYQDYMAYQSIIRKDEKSIYLAKNNNFLLRYPSIRKWNSKFRTVILFRHPLYHAASLLDQHVKFSELQEEDAFTRTYMEWLGHHEFGLSHKPFVFSEEDERALRAIDDTKLDYWVKVWIRVYQYALEIKDEKTLFVSYEAFCEKPQEVLSRITEGLEGVHIPNEMQGHINQRAAEDTCDPDIMRRALDVYESLVARV